METARPRAVGGGAKARRAAAAAGTTAPAAQLLAAVLGQLAISGPGLRMFIGEPQKHKADNWHYYVNWKNQSHVTGREIVRDDHLVNVTAGCAQ